MIERLLDQAGYERDLGHNSCNIIHDDILLRFYMGSPQFIDIIYDGRIQCVCKQYNFNGISDLIPQLISELTHLQPNRKIWYEFI